MFRRLQIPLHTFLAEANSQHVSSPTFSILASLQLQSQRAPLLCAHRFATAARNLSQRQVVKAAANAAAAGQVSVSKLSARGPTAGPSLGPQRSAYGALRGTAASTSPLPYPSRLNRSSSSSSSSSDPSPTRSSSSSSSLKSARVELRKRFGQHLLKNPDVVKNIIAAAKLEPEDTVLEIGPGTGNMTVHLLQQCRLVYAVELDRNMFRAVTQRVEGMGLSHKFRCINDDFLKVKLPPFNALVANIPYQISSPVLKRFFEQRPLPSRGVIMFQKEFAERMVARPGTQTYCRLSVNCALMSSLCRIALHIDRNQFSPPPKVDSAVIELVPKLPPEDLHFEHWDSFLRLCFSGKNKTLRGTFSNKTYLRQLLQWRLRQGASKDSGAAANDAAAAPVAVHGESSWQAEEQEAHDSTLTVDVQDEDDEEEDAAAPEEGQRSKAAPALTEEQKQMLALKQEIHAVLHATATSTLRPNALPLDSFLSVFRQLYAKGLRFLPPGKRRLAAEANTPAVHLQVQQQQQ